MNLDDFARLSSAEGLAALERARSLSPRAERFLRDLQAMRRAGFDDALARAALETARLQIRARARFGPRAERMRFEREALEMASAPAVARHRARRFRGFRRAVDLGCGIGGDLCELARECETVGVERDALRAAIARHNARACAPEGAAHVVVADALAHPLADGAFDAAWADPARRDARGRRRTHPHLTDPPLDALLERYRRCGALGVKLSPAVDPRHLPPDGELEWISVAGELRECVLWTGAFRTAERRATIVACDVSANVPRADTHHADTRAEVCPTDIAPAVHTVSGRPAADGPVGDVDEWLFVPDPALVRSGLLLNVAGELDAVRIDANLSWLTASRRTPSPLGRWFRVIEVVGASRRRVEDAVRRHPAARVTVMKRGMDVNVDELARVLTRVAARTRDGVNEHERADRAPDAAGGAPLDGDPRAFEHADDELVVALARRDAGRVAILCRRA